MKIVMISKFSGSAADRTGRMGIKNASKINTSNLIKNTYSQGGLIDSMLNLNILVSLISRLCTKMTTEV